MKGADLTGLLRTETNMYEKIISFFNKLLSADGEEAKYFLLEKKKAYQIL